HRAARPGGLVSARRASQGSGRASGRAVVAAASAAPARLIATPTTMAEFNLYCFAQSGNAYKAALMLQLTGADWTPRFVDFFGGETRTPAYRAINVMGEVPVLEHAGERMSQSGVILDYLATVLGKFGARDEAERRDVLRWILFDNHKLTSYTATYRFMRMFLPNAD